MSHTRHDARPAFLLGYTSDIPTANYIHSRIEFGILNGRYWEYDRKFLERRETTRDSDD
jgi:hypothetical protein